jgi:hypothetical protein
MALTLHPVAPPKIVATATDTTVRPANAFADPDLPAAPPKYGQDFTFAKGRKAPGGQSVGTTEADLKAKMAALLDVFAAGDATGMARRLFAKFLAKQSAVTYFEDKDLNAAAATHPNIEYFCKAALGAPAPVGIPPAPGKTRIHQALQAAGWDVTRLAAPTDLGVPAFNQGSKALSTGDFNNGLGLMINGVQYVYAIATDYGYDAAGSTYGIKLKYIFYDVFGLDDTDLTRFGASSDSSLSKSAIGITAWWQLQHQFGYAPLVTRIVVEKEYTVPAV